MTRESIRFLCSPKPQTPNPKPYTPDPKPQTHNPLYAVKAKPESVATAYCSSWCRLKEKRLKKLDKYKEAQAKKRARPMKVRYPGSHGVKEEM